ncbi:MAG: hypothetical protein ACP5J4_20190 [Anaerolineae bacterium]
MPDIVIQAESLGKHDTTGHRAENGRDVALRDGLVNNARKLCVATSTLWQVALMRTKTG